MVPPQSPSESRPSDKAPADLSAAKTALRDRLLTSRRRLSLREVGEAASAMAEHLLGAGELRRAATVAAYISFGTEPGTGLLVDRLYGEGRRVLLPVLLPDGDLDWAAYRGPGSLVPARMGLLEPAGTRLGVDAVAGADAVLVPGLAVSPTGVRLGRGGGSYDRALGRVPVGTFTCVLLYDEEAGLVVPVEAHDRPVTAVATPSGITRLRGRTG